MGILFLFVLVAAVAAAYYFRKNGMVVSATSYIMNTVGMNVTDGTGGTEATEGSEATDVEGTTAAVTGSDAEGTEGAEGTDGTDATGGEAEVSGVSGPEPAPEYILRKSKTPSNDWGVGNAIYLDRHDVTCGQNSVLNTFHLRRAQSGNAPPGTDAHDQIYYDYTCLDGFRNTTSNQKETGANDWGGGNTIYLDRHEVNCDKKFLNRFKLKRPSENTIGYDYTCNSAEVDESTCRNVKIDPQEDGGGNSIYLDRQNVACGAGEAMTRFRLTRPSGNTIAYDYTCCKPKA